MGSSDPYELVSFGIWSTPSFGVAEDADFGDAFVRALIALPRNAHLQSVAFDLATGAETSPATIRSVVQLAMSPLMYRGKVHKVSSKPWRELPVIGFLAGLRPTDVCALGDWSVFYALEVPCQAIAGHYCHYSQAPHLVRPQRQHP